MSRYRSLPERRNQRAARRFKRDRQALWRRLFSACARKTIARLEISGKERGAAMKEQEYIRLMVKNIINRGGEVGIEDAIAEAVTYLNATITGQAEAIREQTAKVQERDERLEKAAEWMREEGHRYISENEQLKRRVDAGEKEIERLNTESAELKQEIERWRFCYSDTPERLAAKDTQIKEVGQLAMERREEIERLRAALLKAKERFEYIEYEPNRWDTSDYASEGAEEIDSALKGAE